ncbi:MAG: flagellar hook-basal body complex protein [Rhodospirillaceae bacterium]|jgi:flagellar hook protein FlgE
MPLFGAFAPSVSAMLSQSHALNVIGKNVANVSTGGYKRIDTHFASLVSAPLARGGGAGEQVLEVKSSSDFGGVRTKDFNRIADQGIIASSLSDLDIAVNGQGMLILNTQLGGTGETLYTRDGSLQILTGPQLSVNGIGGVPIQVDSGYLADKNGHLLQGIPVNPDGSFTLGTPQDIRVDPFAFSDFFLPTSVGTLTANLPANDPITQPQVDTVTLGGVVETGDTYSVTVEGTTVTVTGTTGQSLNNVRDALVTALNGNATINAVVTASAGGDGVIRLTNNNIISTFSSSATATNGGATVDNTATAALLQNPDASTQINTFSFEIIDSAGAAQTIRLAFDKVGTNAWEMRTTTFQNPTAQVDTITVAGSVEAGDVYSITVGGQTVNYTVNGLEGGLADIRNGIMGALANNATIASTFIIAPGATNGDFTITARTAGVPFTTTASVNDLNIAQVDTVTIGGTVGVLETGDTYTVNVNGTDVVYTLTGLEANITAVRDNLLAAINADPTVGPVITATPSGAAAITLTANAAGTPFTTTAAFTDIAGGVNDSTAVVVNTTTGSNGDNTATAATTTANVVSEVVSAPISITFDGAGNLTSASTLNLSFNFQSGATGALALDLVDFTQFAGEFIPQDFTRDGFGIALMRSFDFNTKGELVGEFDDNTFRTLYKLPLAQFINVDGLGRRNGNTFVQSLNSGPATLTFAGGDGAAVFVPNARELSNVELADEFTDMITVQTAYNAASKAFTTVDEMLTVARDLKR